MKIGLVGKPNVGKSTFWSAATLAEAEIGDYPFTTIDANRGMAFVRVEDPGHEFGVTSTPRTGKVVGSTRYVPVEVVDVAGLVPGAHEGRGLGNKFLGDLAQAQALIHVVDASGTTDTEGNPGITGHNPMDDVEFLENEINAWIGGILKDGWERVARRVQQEHRKVEVAIAERLSGIGVSETMAAVALRDANLAGIAPVEWDDDALERLAVAVRKRSKPILVAWNKVDRCAEGELQKLLEAVPESVAISAQAELALGRAAKSGAITYAPGDAKLELSDGLTDAQRQGLEYIQTKVLAPHGSTGLHKALEAAAFKLLSQIPVFPVEDESKLTDKEGRVLPDCHLVPVGTTAKELAYRVHSDLGDHFVRGIDCRSKRAVGADHELAAGDVIKIAANA